MRFTLIMGAIFFLGCSDVQPIVEDEFEVVQPGKEDNYRSPSTQEYSAEAAAQVVLEASLEGSSDEDRLAKAQELVSAKLLQIGWFLNLYVTDKEDSDANRNYGGFNAMARNASVQALKIEPVDKLTYSFNFAATIAGKNDFMKVLPGEVQPDGAKLAQLKMGKISNEDLLGGTWQGGYDVHTWDPAPESPSDLETLTLLVKPLTRSSNAYLNYQALYADDKLTVGAQFGWDYNSNRADLANARQLYRDLLEIGFTSPVARYEELKIDSPPLTRTARIGSRTVQVEVSLIHPDMVESPAANAVDLRNALLNLLATREVILFNGHAGVSGRLLPADFRATSAGNIMPTEYPKLKLLPGFQLLLVDGCQTYARFTDGFRQNPLKKGPNGELVNMDIVTSTSYVWTSEGAEIMEAILWPLIGEDAGTRVKPATWDDVLRALNESPNEVSFFGVNGIDNDPHSHPYARSDLLGIACENKDKCGGEGNICTRINRDDAAKTCATVCLDDLGCPAEYRCADVASNGTVVTKGCVKK